MASMEGNAPGVVQEGGSSPVKLALSRRLQNIMGRKKIGIMFSKLTKIARFVSKCYGVYTYRFVRAGNEPGMPH